MSDKQATVLKAATAVCVRLQAAGHQAFFVGGAVRDQLLGIIPQEYDIVTFAPPEETMRLFAKTIPLGVKYGIVVVVKSGVQLQVATFRVESGYEDGRHPQHVSFASAREDVQRRDFTINGLLQDPSSGEVLDYVGGKEDIARGVIRTIGAPEERFSEDFLRMLRAVRFAANLRFTIEEKTLTVLTANSAQISKISAERVREELTKILLGGAARRGFEILHQTGLLAATIPELLALCGCPQPPQYHPEGDVWEHTLRVLGEADKSPGLSPELAWAGLLHDVGKPSTISSSFSATAANTSNGVKGDGALHFYGHHLAGVDIADKIARRLCFSTAQRELIKSLVGEHMRFIDATKMRASKLKKFLRDDNFALHLELHRWDCLAARGDLTNHRYCEEKLLEMASDNLHPPPLVDGRDLLKLGFAPDYRLGKALVRIEEAQLEELISSRAEALELAQRMLMEK